MRFALGFDGDDTLWPNEVRFVNVAAAAKSTLVDYANQDDFDERLLATERRNLEVFGYGSKGYILSLIETVIDMSGGAISTQAIKRIMEAGKSAFASHIELYPDVAKTLQHLQADYDLLLVTKGDLLEQEQKIAQSGIAGLFKKIRILSEKSPHAYTQLLDEIGEVPSRFVMIGNSWRSDILPVLAIGARAILVPCEHIWEHERVEAGLDRLSADDRTRFFKADAIADIPALLSAI